MTTPPNRRGYAAIGAIVEDMEPYLPSSTINRPGYTHCRLTYGLLNTTYKRIEASDAPEKVYKELQQLEHELRRRLQNLNASKGVPVKMTELLNELRNALDHAMTEAADVGVLVQGIGDLLEEIPEKKLEGQPAPKLESKKPVSMVPAAKYEKLEANLAEANNKIQKLNAENNSLTLYVKQLESDREAAERTTWSYHQPKSRNARRRENAKQRKELEARDGWIR